MKNIVFGLFGMMLCYFAYFILGCSIGLYFPMSWETSAANNISIVSNLLTALFILSLGFIFFVAIWFRLISALDFFQQARRQRRMARWEKKNLTSDRRK